MNSDGQATLDRPRAMPRRRITKRQASVLDQVKAFNDKDLVMAETWLRNRLKIHQGYGKVSLNSMLPSGNLT